MDKLHYLFFAIAVIGAFLGGMGVIAGQTNYDTNESLTEVINGILEFQQIQLETDEGMILIFKSIDDDITALNDYDETISSQIGTIRADIKSKFPQAADVIKQEQTSISSTPFLTQSPSVLDFMPECRAS